MNENEGDFNGFFLGFFISILFSMAFKNLLNQYFIVPYSDDISIFYGALLGCYSIPIILALIFYVFFSKIFESIIEKEDPKAKKKSGCRCCGYICYSESEPSPLNIKCGGIRQGFRKCYVNCCCYICCCCECFQCKKCCGDEKTELELAGLEGREKRICIIYKSYGIIMWACDLLTNSYLVGFSLLMFYLQIINYGCRRSLSEHLEKCEDSKKNLLNILSLAGILFFYFLTVISGCLCTRFANFKGRGESRYIGFGLPLLVFTGSLVSFIVSLLYNYDIISEPDTIYYIIPFSIGSIEFYFILLKKCSKVLLKTQLLSFDTLFSVYLLIWNFFAFILDISNTSSSGLILTQFIITVIVIPLSLIAICLVGICKRLNLLPSDDIEKKSEDNLLSKTKENLIEEKDQENIIKEKKEDSMTEKGQNENEDSE